MKTDLRGVAPELNQVPLPSFYNPDVHGLYSKNQDYFNYKGCLRVLAETKNDTFKTMEEMKPLMQKLNA